MPPLVEFSSSPCSPGQPHTQLRTQPCTQPRAQPPTHPPHLYSLCQMAGGRRASLSSTSSSDSCPPCCASSNLQQHSKAAGGRERSTAQRGSGRKGGKEGRLAGLIQAHVDESRERRLVWRSNEAANEASWRGCRANKRATWVWQPTCPAPAGGCREWPPAPGQPARNEADGQATRDWLSRHKQSHNELPAFNSPASNTQRGAAPSHPAKQCTRGTERSHPPTHPPIHPPTSSCCTTSS